MGGLQGEGRDRCLEATPARWPETWIGRPAPVLLGGRERLLVVDQDSFALQVEAARSDPHAARRLLEGYRIYLDLLARAAGGAVRDRAGISASAVVETTIAHAAARLARFRGSSEHDLIAWLRRILTAEMRAHLRRGRDTTGRRMQAEPREALERTATALRAVLAAGRGPTPPSHATRDPGLCLADALAGLRPEQRELILLRSVERRSWEEIVEVTGRSRRAAGMLWARGLVTLHILIAGPDA